MASALLASRNEPCWGERNVYMRNPSNPNPNSRPAAPFSDFNSGRASHFRSLDADDLPTTAGGVPDDSSSYSRKPIGVSNRKSSGGGTYVAFSVSTYSKREQRELRRRLELELEQVRSLASRIQSREFGFPARSVSHVVSSVAVETLNDRKVPLVSPRESKRLAVSSPEMERLSSVIMKKCGQILSKLMKQKKSVWFNSPVDVVGMGLHDYFQIVKNPMDLGTVKSKFNKKLYPSPIEFATDIRLTFNNALLYNPQGHEVHKLAGQYLQLFENMFEPAYEKYKQQLISVGRGEQLEIEDNDKYMKPSRPSVPMSDAAMRSDLAPMQKGSTPPPMQSTVPSQLPPFVQSKSLQMQSSKPQAQVQHQQYPPSGGRIMAGKQPKPKAKDLNKRPMTYEEKQKLGLALESLPHEKMAQVLQIVSKRNGDPMQSGEDEIELDIEVLDTETLWELDRFVSNHKKMMSKMRRQEEARGTAPVGVGHSDAAAPSIAEAVDRSPIQVDTPEAVVAKRSKKLDIGDEDVDIGDEMPPAHYPSVEIEKNAVAASSSSSSGSDSSSSEDSDSDSSSGSDSDDDAQSPGVGLNSSRN